MTQIPHHSLWIPHSPQLLILHFEPAQIDS